MTEIPPQIDTTDEEVMSFLQELLDVGTKTRADAKTILVRWEEIQRAKEEDPNYWHLNK